MFEPATTRALTIPTSDGTSLAVEITEGEGPTFVWLPGYFSDMNGYKASYLKQQCEIWSHRLVRFNYRCIEGPEETWPTSAKFQAQTLTQNVEDAQAVLNQVTDEPVILVGSSMGGWIGMRLLQTMPHKVAGFITVNAAPDFTRGKPETDDIRPGKPPKFATLLRDGRNNFVMDKPIEYNGPLMLLAGQQDKSVPWQTAFDIAGVVTSNDVSVHVIKDADHSLSRPQDLELIWRTMNLMREKVIAQNSSDLSALLSQL